MDKYDMSAKTDQATQALILDGHSSKLPFEPAHVVSLPLHATIKAYNVTLAMPQFTTLPPSPHTPSHRLHIQLSRLTL